MILRYELWDMETANQIAIFDQREKAISVVTEYLRLNGVEAATQLVLGAIYQDGAGTVSMIPVFDGDDVVAIARAGATLDLTS
ncbi:MAG: hypothetical protein U0893_22220 [Chloroflexota bacterium]